MPKKHPRKIAPTDEPVSRELHAAIADHVAQPGRTLYALAALAGIDEAALRRFQSRERSLALVSVDKLALALGLKVIRKARRVDARSVFQVISEPESRREPVECPMVLERVDEVVEAIFEEQTSQAEVSEPPRLP